MSMLEVGDICITQNTVGGLINDGLLVEIHAINESVCRGATPYLIARIDGKPFPASQAGGRGIPSFFSDYGVWSAGYKLRRLDREEIIEYRKKKEGLTAPA